MKLKNDSKAIFHPKLLTQTDEKSILTIGGLNVTCEIVEACGSYVHVYLNFQTPKVK